MNKTVLVLFAMTPIFLTGCGTTRKAQRFDSTGIQQIRVYDSRSQTGATDHLVATVETTEKLNDISEVLRKYEGGWTPVRYTVPTGHLVLNCMGGENRGNAEMPIAQYRICPGSMVTYIDGKAYAQDMSNADQKQICRIVGVEESFFEKVQY